jgi:hypothetical protein
MRRVTRPRGRMMRALPFDAQIQPQNLLARINEGQVSAAPPKQVPPGVLKLEDAAKALQPKGAPAFIIDWLRDSPWIRFVPLALALVLAVLLFLFRPGVIWLIVGIAAIAGSLYLFRLLSRWSKALKRADDILEENQTPEAVDRLPRSPDFVISEPGAGVKPRPGARDSVEAERFKTGLKDLHTLLVAGKAAAALPAKSKLDLPALAQATLQAIDPEKTIPRRVLQSVFIPARLKAPLGEQFVEAMAYPEFDAPMYKPLAEISSELFLPNLNLIEQNSITLLETNQKFIEAYMVGLNHEFARELLWREYPTDQRGSYFRQFWDVSGFFNSENLEPEQLKEKLRDIPPLHRWLPTSNLGDHDYREQPGQTEEEVVLVFGGCSKYPTAVSTPTARNGE